jgi:hypothetical protein
MLVLNGSKYHIKPCNVDENHQAKIHGEMSPSRFKVYFACRRTTTTPFDGQDCSRAVQGIGRSSS